MKKLILLTLVSVFSLSMVAQDDDMYFVPTKENLAKETKNYGMPQKTYYSGSNRSVDEYNRRIQPVYPADSVGNDIIDFSAVRGVYPDSVYSQPAENDDYALTRRMSRFDDYTPSEAYWEGYRAGRWSSPWFSSWYSWYDYDPWYWDSWYWRDPFYYSSWYGWGYRPWYYSSWYYPRYYGYYRPWYGSVRYIGRSGSYSRAGVTHHRTSSARRGTDLGGYRSSNSRTYTPSNSNSGSLGGYRGSSSSSGVSRSGGFSGGGSHSGGGGRSVGGGRSYGGRR